MSSGSVARVGVAVLGLTSSFVLGSQLENKLDKLSVFKSLAKYELCNLSYTIQRSFIRIQECENRYLLDNDVEQDSSVEVGPTCAKELANNPPLPQDITQLNEELLAMKGKVDSLISLLSSSSSTEDES